MPNWSGLWNNHYGQNYSGLGNNTADFNSTELRMMERGFRGRAGRVIGAIVAAVTGNAAGPNAVSTKKRVAHDPHLGVSYAMGGQRTIETETEINRATTAGDVTLIDALVTAKSAPAVYPVDKSGNGGGSKIGSF